MGPDSIVILETGSRWPTWLGDQPYAAQSTAIVAHRPGEALAGFKRRATRRIKSVEAKTAPLTGILVCNGQCGPDITAFRKGALRALLAMMERAGRGHVVLVADGDYSVRQRLAGLARELSDELDEGSPVALRFRVLPRTERAAAAAPIATLRVA